MGSHFVFPLLKEACLRIFFFVFWGGLCLLVAALGGWKHSVGGLCLTSKAECTLQFLTQFIDCGYCQTCSCHFPVPSEGQQCGDRHSWQCKSWWVGDCMVSFRPYRMLLGDIIILLEFTSILVRGDFRAKLCAQLPSQSLAYRV